MVDTAPFLAAYTSRDLIDRVRILKSDEIVNAGSSLRIILYLKNITRFDLINVKIFTDDQDIEISPSEFAFMPVGEVKQVTFIWRPKLNRTEPLNAKIMSIANRVVRP